MASSVLFPYIAARCNPPPVNYWKTSSGLGHGRRKIDFLETDPLQAHLALPPGLSGEECTKAPDHFNTTYHHFYDRWEDTKREHADKNRSDRPARIDRTVFTREYLHKTLNHSRVPWSRNQPVPRTRMTETQEQFVQWPPLDPIVYDRLCPPAVPTGGSLERFDLEPPPADPEEKVLRELDPYISLTQKDHRLFSEGEREAAATYMKPEPPKDPWWAWRRPMQTETMPLPYRNKARRLATPAVPFSGLLTEVQENFTTHRPPIPDPDALCICADYMDKKFSQPIILPSAIAVPEMYGTEQGRYGSCQHPALVC